MNKETRLGNRLWNILNALIIASYSVSTLEENLKPMGVRKGFPYKG